MNLNNDDSKQNQFDVELYHNQLGKIGSGVLYFGSNKWAYVNILSSEKVPDLYIDNAQFDLVKAITNEGITFCLCDCKFNSVSLYADYVIEGDLNEASFHSISVRYSDVSEWFLHRRMLEGSVGKTFNWSQIPKNINVSIKTNEEHFDLRSEYRGSWKQQEENLVIHEHIEFIFSANTNRFNLEDVKEKSHDLSCFLSILLAYPVTIESIFVSQGPGNSYYRLHFPTFDRPERPARAKDNGSFWTLCFIQRLDLDGRWQSIFDQYYQSNYRKICWVRLAGMQRHDGFWEYKLLGYVSLLDSYLNIKFKKEKPPKIQELSSRKVSKFRQELTDKISNIATKERENIIEIARKVFGSDNFNFEKKYKLTIENTNADIKKIIMLSDTDFLLIKQVRNRIAHGNDHGLKPEQFPIVMRSVEKIILLLTYWAFLDFGFTSQEFITYLKKTHSNLKLAAMIDNVHLDRVTRTAEFFPVTVENFQFLREVKRLHSLGCYIEDELGNFTFSEELTTKYRDWMRDSSRMAVICDPEKIFGFDKKQAKPVNHGYFECGGEYIEVHNIWIIKQTASGMPGVLS